MKKRKLLLCLALAALMLSGCGSSSSSSEPDSEENTVTESSDSEVIVTLPQDSSSPDESSQEDTQCTPLTWRITAENGNTMTLMGSMHALDPDIYPLPEKITDDYEAADVLAVECDVNEFNNNLTEQLRLMNMTTYEGDETISDHIKQSTCDSLLEFLNNNGYNMQSLGSYKPWYLQSMCENIVLHKAGLDAFRGFDFTLLNMAHDDGKEIYEVESIEIQLQMLTELPDEIMDIQLASYTVENERQLTDQMRALYDVWRIGDIDKTTQFIKDDEEATKESVGEELAQQLEEYNKKLEDDRNVVMADAAEKLLSEHKNTMFVVGLAHFMGDNGIIKLLEDRGYTVTLDK